MKNREMLILLCCCRSEKDKWEWERERLVYYYLRTVCLLGKWQTKPFLVSWGRPFRATYVD